MKRLMILLVIGVLLTGCGKASGEAVKTEEPEQEQAQTQEEEDKSDLDVLNEIEVDENLLTVEITVPKEYVGESTQEELDETAKEIGAMSIALNDDGSATYKMTKAQHKKFLGEMRDSVKSSLQEMVGSEEYPNITEIVANDNFTEFKVATKNKKLDIAESFSTFTFYMNGFIYSIFSGEDIDNVSVTFINADSGEVIETANSKDMEDETSESEKAKSEKAKSAEEMLSEIQNWYVGDIWNNFVDFDSYRQTGKDCTGSEIDIDFAYEDFKEKYALKEEYNSYISSLSEEYGDLKNVWGKMNEQIEMIYTDLEENGMRECAVGLKLDLLRQYSDKFYELIR